MYEQRWLKAGTEVRATSEGDELSLIGMAASFGTYSSDLGGFRETIAPGAFANSLAAGTDCKCLYNHAPDAILGRTKNSTLRVTETSKGLAFRVKLPPTQLAKDVYTLVQRGDADSCSFAFMVDGKDGESWSEIPDPDDCAKKIPLRTLRRVNLLDVSVLSATPAYPGNSTSVGVDRCCNITELNSVQRNFPEGIPASFPIEVRSRLLAAPVSSNKGREARQRLLALVLS